MSAKQLLSKLIQPTRVAPSNSSITSLALPFFPLRQHHFGQLSNNAGAIVAPSDFHANLCNKIKSAQNRIILASLYIGVGSDTMQINGLVNDDNASYYGEPNCKEDELLQALTSAAANNNINKLQILLDANRALRKVSVTNIHGQSHEGSARMKQTSSSAEALYSRIDPYLKKRKNSPQQNQQQNGLFLFHVNDKRLCTILPSPLDEVAGVFHIKAYIVDDELILSGANLSEEYFSDRLDRYMLFKNGGGGLVDFYSNLCGILCEYSIRYDEQSNDKRVNNLSSLFSVIGEKDRKQKLELSLMQLFDGSNYNMNEVEDDQIVAYAIPTFQMPQSFLGRSLRFQSDTETTRNLLLLSNSERYPASVHLSSAYLNLTPRMLSVLTKYGKQNDKAYILTAGELSHGFAPKAGSHSKSHSFIDKIKTQIPTAFFTLVKEISQGILSSGGKVLLYNRTGWTFHAKGIWIASNDEHHSNSERINNPSSLVANIIGSGNYGARSEDLDVESNCILVFNDNRSEGVDGNVCKVKESVAAEWNNMCDSCNELNDVSIGQDSSSKVMRVVLEFMKRFL